MRNQTSKLSVEEVIKFWAEKSHLGQDPLSKIWCPDRPIWNIYTDNLHAHYLRPYISKLKPSDKVLDIGCGIGRFTFRFAKFCNKVYGIDTSKENIAFAKTTAQKEKITKINFSVMDARNLKFVDGTFDYAFSVTCLQHITDKMNLILAFKELFRVTKKNGYIILLEDTSKIRKREPDVISMPREEWFKIIKRSGGRIEYWCGTDLPLLRKVAVTLPFKIICHFVTRKGWKIEGNAFDRDKKLFELYNNNSKRNKIIEHVVMMILVNLIKLFEYTIPKLWKNQSMYTVMIIKKE